MKVFLFLIVLLQGEPKPIQDGVEVPDLKTCQEQLAKLFNQPLPRNVVGLQAGCTIRLEGEKT